jgi:hypothetical protein
MRDTEAQSLHPPRHRAALRLVDCSVYAALADNVGGQPYSFMSDVRRDDAELWMHERRVIGVEEILDH